MTHVELSDGQVFEVLNMIDDHSSLCLASRAMRWSRPTTSSGSCTKRRHLGIPGLVPHRQRAHLHARERRYGVAGVIEQELFALGIEAKHSRPYHPQTCGKVERLHQTLKKFLATQTSSRSRSNSSASSIASSTTTTRCARIEA